MGFLEPGPVGNLDVGERKRGHRFRNEVIVRFAIAAALLVLWAVFVILRLRSGNAMAMGAAGTIVYLFAAYVMHPKADETNLGWFGGLMNNPFRFSDNINRFLLLLKVFLLPGRFISEALVDMVRMK